MTQLPAECCTTVLGIFVALSAGSLLVLVWKLANPTRDLRQIFQRLRTWWVIAGLFSFSLLWSPTAAIVFLGLVSYLALKEFLSMTPTRRADRRVLFYAYLAVLGQYYFAGSARYELFLMFIPVLMFAWIPTRMWMIGQTEGFLRAAGTLHWALMVTVFSLSHAAFLVVFPISDTPRVPPDYPSPECATYPGAGLLLFVVLITELSDIFRQLGNAILGERKIAPRISPGNTYAGLVCGIICAVLAALVVGPRITPMDMPRSLMAGLVIAIAGFAGHLCLSAMKRDLRIRDFGATLPGHGGVLDRVDSLVFTAPLFFHFLYYCYG